MSINYTVKNQMPDAVDRVYSELPSEGKQIINCTICGEVEVPSSYIVYKFNGKEFCSYNCKHKYIKEHPEERELTASEYQVEKFNRLAKINHEKHIENYKKKKRKK